jgi:protein involved in sex pheromone biosynthesis
MRKLMLIATLAGAITVAGCSKKTEQNADEATQSAAADAEANADTAAAAATDAKNSAEANLQGESKEKAAKD